MKHVEIIKNCQLIKNHALCQNAQSDTSSNLMEHADSVVIMKKLMQIKEIAILNSAKQASTSQRMPNVENAQNIRD